MKLPEFALGVGDFSVSRTKLENIWPLRGFHRQEMNCQIIQDSFPMRKQSDPYGVFVHGEIAGYGLVANQYYKDAVTEFYLVPPFRHAASRIFRELLNVSSATHIRTQTNDRHLLMMLYEYAGNIAVENYLFADLLTTSLPCPGGEFRKAGDKEKTEFLIEMDGNPVATGGLMFHYNPPYGDIYMEVQEAYRGRGFGSYMVQELKRIAYGMGKIPSARCDGGNTNSRKTLEKAGMLPCGRVLQGEVRKL